MDYFAQLGPDARRRLRRSAQPDWIAPMLATLTDRRFSDPGWLFERKLDGERCLAFCTGPEIRLLSRTRRQLGGTYPEIVDALAGHDVHDLVVDGEIVAFEGRRTSFGRLQQRLGITDPQVARRSPVRVYYYVFDLLHLDGFDTTALGLRDRKSVLRRGSRSPTRCGSPRTETPMVRRISGRLAPMGGKA